MPDQESPTISLKPALCEGLRHHARGHLLAAAECYRQACAADADDVDALLLLGILARQTRQFAAAVALIERAAKRKPQAAHIQFNLALAHLGAGQKELAASCCQSALALAPRWPRAWCCLAEIEISLGREPEAHRAFEHAMSLPGGTAPGALGLGHLLCTQGRHEEALAIYAKALHAAPDNANLHFAAGVASRALRRTSEAKAAYRKAIALRPNFPEVHLSLGNVLTDEGNFLGAAHACRRAIALRPGYAKAHCNLGNTLCSLGRHAEAVSCFERAIALQPESTAARHNLGYALLRRREYARAEQCFREALRLQPENARHHDGLGNALFQQRRTAEAEECYRQAIQIESGFSAAHTNLANALLTLGRQEEMDHHYRRALELDPESAGGNYNLALSCLRKGDFAEGWRRHERRWEFRELNLPPRNFQQPQWRGQKLNGKTILLHAEQGLGDTLMFARYVSLVAELGGRVVLEVQPRLRRLLASMHGAHTVIERGNPLPSFEYHCPLMSLPLAFDTRLDSIPAAVPYVRPDSAEVASAWQRHPRLDLRPRVGLAWAGNPQMKGDPLRSTTLVSLAPLAEVREAAFFSLQFGSSAAEIESSRLPIIDGCSRDRDFAETAALMATLDLVISVDTSVAHLAGAMGLPVWVILPYLADWRWMDGREDSPWYPTARLFRQTTPGDWSTLVGRVREELLRFCRAWQTASVPTGDESDRRSRTRHEGPIGPLIPSFSGPSECGVPAAAPR